MVMPPRQKRSPSPTSDDRQQRQRTVGPEIEQAAAEEPVHMVEPAAAPEEAAAIEQPVRIPFSDSDSDQDEAGPSQESWVMSQS